MKEEWIAYVLKQTLQGLKYFHDQGQVWATALLLVSDAFYLALTDSCQRLFDCTGHIRVCCQHISQLSCSMKLEPL